MGTISGKNCFSFGIDIFCRGHRGHAVNKCPKLLSLLINFVPITSRGQKLSTGDTGDKIALSTRVNPNKCRQLAQFKTMLSTGWPKLRFFCPRLFPAETPQNRQRLQFMPPLTERCYRHQGPSAKGWQHQHSGTRCSAPPKQLGNGLGTG